MAFAGHRKASKNTKGKAKDTKGRAKVCRICENSIKIDYKDEKSLRRFVAERGKIIPRRMSGTCARHQRLLATAIKRARHLALLPFSSETRR